jgi:hypothetical protein
MVQFPYFKMNYAVSGDSVIALNKDIREARICFNNAAYKATMVMCGSVLEHALLDRLSIDNASAKRQFSTLFGNRRVRSIEYWGLDEMLQVARDLNLITPEIYQLCDMLRNYRNLIHSGASRRGLINPNQTRGQRSLEVTKQALGHIESQFISAWQNVYVINIQNISCNFVNNKAIVQAAIINTAQRYGFTTHVLSSYTSVSTLLKNPPKNIIIVNAHGEIMPVPRGRKWRNYYAELAKVVNENGWILVNIGGYPFYYFRDTQPQHCAAMDGLNTFLSVNSMTGDCMNPAVVRFTSDGQNIVNRANMTNLPHSLVASRCAKWQGVSQQIVFLKNDNNCGASAIRMGRGWFVNIGLDSAMGLPNPTQQQLAWGDTILGNFGTAAALYVADKL